MRSVSHTLIGILLDHVTQWRKRERWSRETVVQQIVEAHERIGANDFTEISFEDGHPDVTQRMKNNADRVFRWLDDQTKDNNFLPANFIPSILAALPEDLRTSCTDAMLLPAQLGSRLLDAGTSELDVVGMLRSVLKEDALAQEAIAELLVDASEEHLMKARREVSSAIDALQHARSEIEIALSRIGGRSSAN